MRPLLETIIWAAGFGGHCLLVLVLLLRRRWQRFPVFTLLIAYHIPFTVLLWSALHFRPGLYPAAFWTEEGIDFVLQLGLLAELALLTLRRKDIWLPETKEQLVIGSIVGILLAGILAMKVNAPGVYGKDLWDMRANVFTSLLACTMILLSAIAANRLGLHQKEHISAIAHGFAFWAAIALISDVSHLQTGWSRSAALFDQVADGAWIGVLLYWSIVLWRPERSGALLSKRGASNTSA